MQTFITGTTPTEVTGMSELRVRWPRLVWSGLVIGLVLNLLGWVGNQVFLGDLWDSAIIQVVPLRTRSWANEVISLVPDFIYGIALAWTYAGIAPRFGWGWAAAWRASLLIWAVGAFTTYLGVANSGLLPTQLALWTTLVAIVTVVPAVWLAQRLVRPNHP